MSRKRTFIVRVNIDDMAAMLAGLDGPLEKAEWLDGYMVGVHGHPARETWQEAKRIGFEFGALHFREVEEFRAEQKAKSDLAELAKLAKKHPEGTHGLPTGTGSGNPAGDPIQQSNNPTIQRTRKPKSQFSAEAEALYLAYPKKVDPVKAKQAIENALKTASFDSLMAAVQAYASSREGEDPHYTKHPSGWFNDCRYLDDPSTWIKTAKQSKNGVKHDGFAKTDYFAGLEDLPTGD